MNPFRLKIGRAHPNNSPDDTGAWQSDDGDLAITWKAGSGSGPWNLGAMGVAIGAAGQDFGVPTQAGRVYRYTLVVTSPDPSLGSVTIDPEVEVTDGGGPGGKKATKKATKKAAKRKNPKRK